MSVSSITKFDIVNRYQQFRSFDNLYLFKLKNEGTLKLKIFDISQKCLFTKTFSASDLSGRTIELFKEESFFNVLESLSEKHLLPNKYLPVMEHTTTFGDCLSAIENKIDQFKPTILAEPRELDSLCCPITLEIFKDPVIDDHGHTFEKSAIEEYMQAINRCPINRQPIHSLTPNRLVRSTIEEFQKKEPIPTFSLFSKARNNLAEQNLKTAIEYIEEKEYEEALESYSKAFKYTKSSKDYANLPPLFIKMKETNKAALAYLYLSSYQLQENLLQKATQTLQKCQELLEKDTSLSLLLLKLYKLTGQDGQIFNLSVKIAQSLSTNNPAQAITLYQEALTLRPDAFPLYFKLSSLLPSYKSKAHILLKGACFAMPIKAYEMAEDLCLEASKYSPSYFFNKQLYLQLLKKKGKHDALYSYLLAMGLDYEEKGLFRSMLLAYKMLFHSDKKGEYCSKIILAYEKLNIQKKQLHWSLESIRCFIEEKNWQKAEEMTLKALKKSEENSHLALFQSLKYIYSNWHGHKLEDLYATKLGKSYVKNNQLDEAEKTYRLGLERFHNIECSLALASLLVSRKKITEGVRVYYETSSLALLNKDFKVLDLCVSNIKKVDPHMSNLNSNQKMHLLTHSVILDLSSKLERTNSRLRSLENDREIKLARKREATIRLEKKREEILSSRVCFGKSSWEKYLGNIGDEPPLPDNIVKILESHCPIWPGKKVINTHLLVLIPSKVNGCNLTLNSFRKLVKNPLQGDPVHCSYSKAIESQLGNRFFGTSHWVLFSKDVIPSSRNEGYSTQCVLVESLNATCSFNYTLPFVLEAAISILASHFKNGVSLYKTTFTRCQKREGLEWSAVIGSFNECGLNIYKNSRPNSNYGMALVVRKF